MLSTGAYFNNCCEPDYQYGLDISDSEIHVEGERRLHQSYKYERDPIARRKCIEKHGTKCSICGFDFGKVYGRCAQGKIHVHHIIPLSTTKTSQATNPNADLMPICPNCHYVIHLKYPPYSPEEIKKFFGAAYMMGILIE